VRAASAGRLRPGELVVRRDGGPVPVLGGPDPSSPARLEGALGSAACLVLARAPAVALLMGPAGLVAWVNADDRWEVA